MMTHCQIGKNEPREPDCSEPELAVEPEESLFMTPVRSESEARDLTPVDSLDPELKEFKELREFEEPTRESLDPEEESQGVTVVVVTWKVAISVGPTVAACPMARSVKATNVLMAQQRVRCENCQNTRSC